MQWENLQEAEQAEAGAVAEAGEEAGKEAGFRKDANEVLMKDGPEALRFCIDQAEPLPIRGLFRSASPLPPFSPAQVQGGLYRNRNRSLLTLGIAWMV